MISQASELYEQKNGITPFDCPRDNWSRGRVCVLLDQHRFRTRTEARVAVFDYIEGFYNPRRRHSTLGQLSPVDYERRHTTVTAA